jgi:hypothetical protein
MELVCLCSCCFFSWLLFCWWRLNSICVNFFFFLLVASQLDLRQLLLLSAGGVSTRSASTSSSPGPSSAGGVLSSTPQRTHGHEEREREQTVHQRNRKMFLRVNGRDDLFSFQLLSI